MEASCESNVGRYVNEDPSDGRCEGTCEGIQEREDLLSCDEKGKLYRQVIKRLLSRESSF